MFQPASVSGEETIIIGIDPASSHVAYGVFNHNTGDLVGRGWVSIVAEPRLRPYELAEALCVDLEEAGYPVEDQVFWIEQPFGRNISGIAAVERTIGGLLYCLSPRADLINVQSWKRACQVPPTPKVTRVNAHWKVRRDAALATLQEPDAPKITSKTLIKARALELFPALTDTEKPIDIYDACCIGYTGYLIDQGEFEIT